MLMGFSLPWGKQSKLKVEDSDRSTSESRLLAGYRHEVPLTYAAVGPARAQVPVLTTI